MELMANAAKGLMLAAFMAVGTTTVNAQENSEETTYKPVTVGNWVKGEEVTGKTFIDYSVNFSNLFRNEDTYPDSSMIMDAACDVSNCKIIDNYCVV